MINFKLPVPRMKPPRLLSSVASSTAHRIYAADLRGFKVNLSKTLYSHKKFIETRPSSPSKLTAALQTITKKKLNKRAFFKANLIQAKRPSIAPCIPTKLAPNASYCNCKSRPRTATVISSNFNMDEGDEVDESESITSNSNRRVRTSIINPSVGIELLKSKHNSPFLLRKPFRSSNSSNRARKRRLELTSNSSPQTESTRYSFSVSSNTMMISSNQLLCGPVHEVVFLLSRQNCLKSPSFDDALHCSINNNCNHYTGDSEKKMEIDTSVTEGIQSDSGFSSVDYSELFLDELRDCKSGQRLNSSNTMRRSKEKGQPECLDERYENNLGVSFATQTVDQVSKLGFQKIESPFFDYANKLGQINLKRYIFV